MLIQNNVPRCPSCSALMFMTERNNKLYMVCHDCLKPYRVEDNGQAEIELYVTDVKEEE